MPTTRAARRAAAHAAEASINDLSHDLLEVVCTHLGGADVARVACTSKVLSEVCSRPSLLREMARDAVIPRTISLRWLERLAAARNAWACYRLGVIRIYAWSGCSNPRGIELLQTARAAGGPAGAEACHELALHAGGTTCQSQKAALFQEAAALGHFRAAYETAEHHRRRLMREKLDSLGLEGTTLDHWDALIAPEVRAAWDQVDLLNEQDGTRQDLVLQGRAYACCNPAGCSRWRIRRTKGKKQPWKAVNAEVFGQPTGVTWGDVGPGPAPNIRRCRECEAAAYCSPFCQMTHWLGSSHSGGTSGPDSHKPECLRLRALRAGV